MDTPALVQQLRAEIASRDPVDERERLSIERFLTEVDELADPFNEHNDPIHVTGSAIVVGARGVLLHKHRVLGIWIQPGGHIDDGETPWEAAVRETIEETGLPARLPSYEGVSPPIAHIDVHPGPRGHTHLDLRYVVESDDVDPAPPAGESQDVYWFEWDAAIECADDGLRGALIAMRPGAENPS